MRVGTKIRRLRSHGLDEGVSTRLLIYAGRLIGAGLPAEEACAAAMVQPLSDDPDMQRSMSEVIRDFF